MKKIRIISELDDREMFEVLARVLGEIYNLDIVIERGEILNYKCFNSRRKQYDAWKLIEIYSGERREDEYLLLIVGEDIYASGFNYIFGLAWQKVAVISTYRLRQEFYGQDPDHKLFIERSLKEAVHEVGHLHNLTHCSNRRCVMAFSNWIGDTDYKSWELCEKCRAKLRNV
ncbi:MAG: archaemetzincin family Zn-dependent metalloprotease [Candidatus Caldarchaeales archaeon]